MQIPPNIIGTQSDRCQQIRNYREIKIPYVMYFQFFSFSLLQRDLLTPYLSLDGGRADKPKTRATIKNDRVEIKSQTSWYDLINVPFPKPHGKKRVESSLQQSRSSQHIHFRTRKPFGRTCYTYERGNSQPQLLTVEGTHDVGRGTCANDNLYSARFSERFLQLSYLINTTAKTEKQRRV